MKKKSMLVFLMTLIVLITSMPMYEVSAATTFPSVSTSSYIEFTAIQNIPVYCCKTLTPKYRGTESPKKRYNALVEEGDIVYILGCSSSCLKVSYPVGASRRRVGYIARAAVIPVTAPSFRFTSTGKAYTYVNSTVRTTYGYVEKGDSVYICGQAGRGYSWIIYSAKSGSRAYKFAALKDSDLSRIKTQNNGNINNKMPKVNQTLPLPNLKGLSKAEALARVAESQIGYQGLSYDGSTHGDYNAYAEQNGFVNGQHWCAAFTYWVASKSGVSKSLVPSTAQCKYMFDHSRASRVWSESSARRIKRGDLVFFSNKASKLGETGHVGVVTGVSISKSKIIIKTVEGNTSNDLVKRCSYTCTLKTGYTGGYWKYIGGYISI